MDHRFFYFFFSLHTVPDYFKADIWSLKLTESCTENCTSGWP